MRPEQRREQQQGERQAPTPAQRHEEQRDEQQVRGRERREERRGQPTEDDAVPGVVDEVLRQVREPDVAEPELVGEPPGSVPPERQRHGIDVDQPERGDERGSGKHRVADAGPLTLGQLQPAAEEVGADRQQIVARRIEDALVGRAPAEPRLREQTVKNDERAEGEREPVNGLQRAAALFGRTSASAASKQHVLPRGHDRQRRLRAARRARAAPSRRCGARARRSARAAPRPASSSVGPTAISVIPRLSTRTL